MVDFAHLLESDALPSIGDNQQVALGTEIVPW